MTEDITDPYELPRLTEQAGYDIDDMWQFTLGAFGGDVDAWNAADAEVTVPFARRCIEYVRENLAAVQASELTPFEIGAQWAATQ